MMHRVEGLSAYRIIWRQGWMKFVVVILLVLFIALNTSVFAQQEIGTVVMVLGKAYIQRGEREEFPAKQGEQIFEKDTLRTEGTAKLKIYLNDDSVITLGENTRLSIEEYMLVLKEEKRSVLLSLVGGRLRVVVGKILKAAGSRYEVKTPTSITGVRGTHFYIFAMEALTRIAVLSGAVDIRNILEKIPGVVSLRAGQMSIVPEEAQPGEPVELSQDELLQLMLETEIYEEGGFIEEEELPEIKTGIEEKESDIAELLKREVKGLKVDDKLPPLDQEPIKTPSEVTVIIRLPQFPGNWGSRGG